MKEDLYDLILDLRLAEKRILNLNRKTKNEEEDLHDQMINALMEGDREAAKDYARIFLTLKKRRKKFREFLGRIKTAKVKLRKASAAEKVSDSLIKAAKGLGKMKNYSSDPDLLKATEKLETNQVSLPSTSQSVQRNEVKDLLNEVELEVETKTEEILPTIPDKETLKEDMQIKEKEEE